MGVPVIWAVCCIASGTLAVGRRVGSGVTVGGAGGIGVRVPSGSLVPSPKAAVPSPKSNALRVGVPVIWAVCCMASGTLAVGRRVGIGVAVKSGGGSGVE